MKKKSAEKNRAGSYQFRKKSDAWCILFIPMACTVWLKYYPIFSAFFISLFNYDPINQPGKFVGFQNYVDIFQMQGYWDSWKNTFILLALQLCMCFLIPLIQALLLNELVRLKKCLTTLYILPGIDSDFCKRNYMEMDLASGLRCGKPDREVFWRSAADMAQ